jgi:LPXTG-motif cell wall-anchored protein
VVAGIRRVLGVLIALIASTFVSVGPARAGTPIPAPDSGIVVGCGFLDVLAVNHGPGDQEYQFYDNGKLVWNKLLLAENEFQEPAKEGHTYKLTAGGTVLGQVTYHRPAVCGTAKLSVTVTSDPSCSPLVRRMHVTNTGAATVPVSTEGSWGNYVDFVDLPPGASHDFVGTGGRYVAVGSPTETVLYEPAPATPPTGCGEFTSKLTALCGQVRWDVATKAIGSQELTIFREFGPIPKTPVSIWSETLPAKGSLTAYAPAVKDDTILATLGYVRGSGDAFIDKVISRIDSFADPAACARPEKAAVTYKGSCASTTATITNYGAEQTFTVSAGTEVVKTVTLAPGDVAEVKVPLAAGQSAAVAVSGKDPFSTHDQRTCPSASGSGSGGSGSGGSGGGGGLPITGAPVVWIALTGAVLLLGGAALMLAMRRRRTE